MPNTRTASRASENGEQAGLVRTGPETEAWPCTTVQMRRRGHALRPGRPDAGADRTDLLS